MRARLERIPTWAWVPLMGVPFGAAMGISSKSDGGSTGFAVVSGVLLGLVFGLAMTFVLRRQRLLLVEALGRETPKAVRLSAGRALRRGPAPADPEVRSAAIRLAERQLEVLRRSRWTAPVLWVFLLIAGIAGVVDRSFWPLALLVLYTVAIWYQFFYKPRKLRARIEELAQGFEEDRS
jgi:hypothetical protein